MTHDELVDSACRTYEIYMLDVPPRDALLAVVAVVLEEAAKVAERSPDSHWGPTIADAIRKLKGEA